MTQQVSPSTEAGRSEAPPPTPTASRRGTSIRSATLTAKRTALVGEDRRRLIAEAAYFLAERRGFAPGQELEDWLAAEIEVDALFGDDEA